MEEKLKPCPFCGGDGFLRTIHNTSFPPRGKPKQWETYFVNCDNAGCPMNNAQEDGEMGGTLNDWKTEEEAIAAWNRRAPQEWEQMTPDTEFDGGERIVAVVNGWYTKLLVWSVVIGFEDERGFYVPKSSIGEFVRIPKQCEPGATITAVPT